MKSITMTMTDSKPWYKQFWPWFLIAIPASSVIVGMVLLTLAIKYKVSLVKGDYYKDGLAINQRLDKKHNARSEGLKAFLTYSPETNVINLRIQNLDTTKAPILHLDLIHPTLENRDQSVELTITPTQTYFAKLATRPSGFYYAQISSVQGDWEIDSKVNFNNPLSDAALN